MGIHHKAVEDMGRDSPIVRRALDCHRAGYMDYETAMESAVLSQAEQIRVMEKMLLDQTMTRPVQFILQGSPCSTA